MNKLIRPCDLICIANRTSASKLPIYSLVKHDAADALGDGWQAGGYVNWCNTATTTRSSAAATVDGIGQRRFGCVYDRNNSRE